MSYQRLVAARAQSIQEHHDMVALDKELHALEAAERAAGRQPPQRRPQPATSNADRLAAMSADIEDLKARAR